MIWLDAQLPPGLVGWLRQELGVDSIAVRDLGYLCTTDLEIFEAARGENAIIMTKDADFVELVNRKGPPPRILWLTCGNSSSRQLKTILGQSLHTALILLEAGESLVEISD